MANCLMIAARHAWFGRPLRVMRPSTYVAYPSSAHRGVPVVMGLSGTGDRE